MSNYPVLDAARVAPIGSKVLLDMGLPEEKSGSIILPATVGARGVDQQILSTLVRFGALAFLDSDGLPLPDAPCAGDQVLVAKYAGYCFRGLDDHLYRVTYDSDVATIYLKEGAMNE